MIIADMMTASKLVTIILMKKSIAIIDKINHDYHQKI